MDSKGWLTPNPTTIHSPYMPSVRLIGPYKASMNQQGYLPRFPPRIPRWTLAAAYPWHELWNRAVAATMVVLFEALWKRIDRPVWGPQKEPLLGSKVFATCLFSCKQVEEDKAGSNTRAEGVLIMNWTSVVNDATVGELLAWFFGIFEIHDKAVWGVWDHSIKDSWGSFSIFSPRRMPVRSTPLLKSPQTLFGLRQEWFGSCGLPAGLRYSLTFVGNQMTDIDAQAYGGSSRRPGLRDLVLNAHILQVGCWRIRKLENTQLPYSYAEPFIFLISRLLMLGGSSNW